MTTELPLAALKADLFKAIAHPIRIRALERLVEAESSVGELADLLELEVTQLSQQLAVLRRANVVATRREGNTIFYSVRDERIAHLLAIAKQLLVAHLENSRTILDSLEEEGSRAANSPTVPSP